MGGFFGVIKRMQQKAKQLSDKASNCARSTFTVAIPGFA